MNYEEMSDKQINKRVAALLGLKESPVSDMMYGSGLVIYPHDNEVNFNPCNNPSDAWHIIVENKITIQFRDSLGLKTLAVSGDSDHADENPLRAAMICFLKMKDSEK